LGNYQLAGHLNFKIALLFRFAIFVLFKQSKSKWQKYKLHKDGRIGISPAFTFARVESAEDVDYYM